MGEILEEKGFVVHDDGTIIRSKRCPKCGRSLLSEGEYCEFCGAKIVKSDPSPYNMWIVLLIIVVVLSILAFIITI